MQAVDDWICTDSYALLKEAMSLGIFSTLVWTGLNLMSPTTRAVKMRELTMTSALKDIGKVHQYMHWVTGLLMGTIVAGTLVAEIDAGRAFNTSPEMGDHWIPKGMFGQKVRLLISAHTSGRS